MRPIVHDPIGRIGVRPEQNDPAAFSGPRPRGSRRPHTDAKVAAVRRLIEQTTLNYKQIAAKTGVGSSSISRWTNDGGWKRPPFAPRSTDMVPTARASAHLKLRMLDRRLAALAERHVRELEDAGCVDQDKLAEALELVKMAKLAARPRKKNAKPGEKVDLNFNFKGERLRPISQLVAAGVDLHRAPKAAIDDFLAHREPPAEKPPHGRSKRARAYAHHLWMLEKE